MLLYTCQEIFISAAPLFLSHFPATCAMRFAFGEPGECVREITEYGLGARAERWHEGPIPQHMDSWFRFTGGGLEGPMGLS